MLRLIEELNDVVETNEYNEQDLRSYKQLNLHDNSSLGFNLNISRKVLDIMYLNTYFTGIDKVIEKSYNEKEIGVVDEYLQQEFSNPNFKSMFEEIYNIVSNFKFRVRNGNIQNLEKLSYELFIFGRKNGKYLIAGFNNSNEFIILNGTYIFPMINFKSKAGELPRAKKIRDKYVDSNNILTNTIDGVKKSLLISFVTGEATNTKNIEEFDILFENAKKKHIELEDYRKAMGLYPEKRKKYEASEEGMTSRGTSVYYCCKANYCKPNNKKDAHISSLNTYKDMTFDALVCAYKNSDKVLETAASSFLSRLAEARAELDNYRNTDLVYQTNTYRNRIKHRVVEINNMTKQYS